MSTGIPCLNLNGISRNPRELYTEMTAPNENQRNPLPSALDSNRPAWIEMTCAPASPITNEDDEAGPSSPQTSPATTPRTTPDPTSATQNPIPATGNPVNLTPLGTQVTNITNQSKLVTTASQSGIEMPMELDSEKDKVLVTKLNDVNDALKKILPQGTTYFKVSATTGRSNEQITIIITYKDPTDTSGTIQKFVITDPKDPKSQKYNEVYEKMKTYYVALTGNKGEMHEPYTISDPMFRPGLNGLQSTRFFQMMMNDLKSHKNANPKLQLATEDEAKERLDTAVYWIGTVSENLREIIDTKRPKQQQDAADTGIANTPGHITLTKDLDRLEKMLKKLEAIQEGSDDPSGFMLGAALMGGLEDEPTSNIISSIIENSLETLAQEKGETKHKNWQQFANTLVNEWRFQLFEKEGRGTLTEGAIGHSANSAGALAFRHSSTEYALRNHNRHYGLTDDCMERDILFLLLHKINGCTEEQTAEDIAILLRGLSDKMKQELEPKLIEASKKCVDKTNRTTELSPPALTTTPTAPESPDRFPIARPGSRTGRPIAQMPISREPTEPETL